MLTADRLRELLSYDPTTGIFRWRDDCAKARAGQIAGSGNGSGYMRVRIDGRDYRSHRLAWLYMTGAWPPSRIDHEDRCRSNNAWPNLRLSTNATNLQNRIAPARSSKSGLIGAHWDKSRSNWLSSIMANGKLTRLGRFSTAQQAHAAYMAAKAQLHPSFSSL